MMVTCLSWRAFARRRRLACCYPNWTQNLLSFPVESVVVVVLVVVGGGLNALGIQFLTSQIDTAFGFS